MFSGFRGGFGVLAGITGGYLIGFLFAALVYWLITAKSRADAADDRRHGGGTALDYVFGTAWFMLFYAKTYGAIGLGAALSMCVFPFVMPDLIKLSLAAALGQCTAEPRESPAALITP